MVPDICCNCQQDSLLKTTGLSNTVKSYNYASTKFRALKHEISCFDNIGPVRGHLNLLI